MLQRTLCLFSLAAFAHAQDRLPVFTAEANLQSIAVQVTDRQGRDIRGLTAGDFTLLEDGRPQKIAFFGAEEQPISLAVLVDSSSSMQSGNKLGRVGEILPPLLRGNLPADEIYFAQFTDTVYPLQTLTGDDRVHPPIRELGTSGGGTAFYDALSTALCTLRGARNLRKAVIVITDGADQHSRLKLNQLIRLAQASLPQIFTIGFFDAGEAYTYHTSGPLVTLVNSHQTDNPVTAFARISKETGAESFFPSDEHDLEKALTRILGILHAQYTLAYHTERPDEFRRIEVKVNHPGARVYTRRALGAEDSAAGLPHFSTTSCAVSAADHPYPWEPHTTKTPDGLMLYREDFTDARSGWPNRSGLRYVDGAYEISVSSAAKGLGTRDPGNLAAYGPWFTNFSASVKIESHGGDGGLIFRLNDRGYYLLLVQEGRQDAYKLVKKFWSSLAEQTIVPWTAVARNPVAASPWIAAAVECTGDRIAVIIDGIQAISLTDGSFPWGQAGMAFFGHGRALFRDLQVEGLP